MAKSKLLTKSKYMNGLESDALLWLAVNEKESLPKPDEATQAKFDSGHKIEVLVRKTFNGIDLADYEFMPNIYETKKLVSEKKIIFEAGFLINKLYVRSDVLIPNNDGSWDLIEIKGSTKVKESHVKDLSFQKHVLELSGLKIRNCFVIHLNRDYIRKDFLDIGLLFTKSEVTKRVEEEIIGIESRIQRMFEIINLPQCPMFDYRDIIKSEYGNPLIDEFYESLPEHSVFELYYLEVKKAIELLDQGTLLIKDIPEEFSLNEKQRIQKETIIKENVHLEKEPIKQFLDKMTYPIYHLDFETMMPPLPLFKNTRSYDQIPFQYSIHIEHETGETEHKEFIYEGKEDPRPEFLEKLKKDLEGAKTIMTYNEGFEIYRLKELAKSFPEHADWLNETIKQIQDLIIPFKTFSYYNYEQRGSCSLKKVMPIFHHRNYEELGIQEGCEASRIYMQNFGILTKEIKQELLRYCELDTECMPSILQGLRKLTE